MAAVAVSLMSYVNDFSDKDDNALYRRAQSTLAYSFVCNLLVVMGGTFVPLFRMLRNKKLEVTRAMITWLICFLLGGLMSMVVAFYFLLTAKLFNQVYIPSIVIFVLGICGVALQTLIL